MATGILAEQVSVRIFQIMIKVSDLPQILYMGHSSWTKCGPRKIPVWPPFSKMVAMGYPKILLFAFKMTDGFKWCILQ